MKLIIAALFAFAFQPGIQQRYALIEGTAIDSANGPIEGVTLMARNVKTGVTLPPVTSGADGRFLIDSMPPGYYVLTTSKTGYAPARPEQRKSPGGELLFDLSGGEPLREVVIHLDRSATITGTVLDLKGSPVVRTQVAAMRPFYNEFGDKKFRTTLGGAVSLTDDRGNFRIFGLTPGEYYVRVEGPNQGTSAEPISIYYPLGAEKGGVAGVRLKPGEEVSLNTILLTFPKTVPARVNIIRDAGAAWGEIRSWQIGPAGLSDYTTRSAISNAFGGPEALEIRSVPVGSNVVRMGWDVPEGKVYGEATFEVEESQEKATVGLIVRKGVRFTSTVLREIRAGADEPRAGVDVQLSSRSPFVHRFSGRTDAKGLVSFDSVPESEYYVTVSGMPENTYIDRIEQNGKNVPWGRIVVAGETRVEVIAKTGGGDLSGRVMNSSGGPVQGSMVAVVPLEKELLDHSHLYRSTTSDQNGKFLLSNLAPGAYQLFAWIETPGPGAFRSPEFLAIYEGRGKPVHVADGEHVVVNVSLADEEQ